ncbi:acyltransferase [Desulfonema ishimotonii]|uniref:Acyltransferase n=1 Tax=Desulfonema ishimotonii TaxID=45657 RepID=A0A401FQI7_9BACT|nr:acyltransferase [Desulfonema ishimotonii]GBC59246.1 acyltransferase [Desulfonema ishimotonii]
MFLNYINNFRGIAILIIVSKHCIDAFDWPDSHYLYRALYFVFHNGTSLFMFISGFLFQYLAHKYEFKTYMEKKLKYVLLPYFIVSVPAVIMCTLFFQRPNLSPDFYANPLIVQVIMFYLTGAHVTAFWFIPMMSLYYIISPLLVRLDQDRRIYYCIPLFILISLLVPRGGTVLKNFIHFFSIYIFGMFCSRYRDKILRIGEKHFLTLLIAYFLFFIGDITLGIYGNQIECVNYLSKLVLCVLLMTSLYLHDDRIKNRGAYLASISFGIYFLHSYVIQLARFSLSDQIGGMIPFQGNLLSYMLLLVVVVGVCAIAITAIKKITQRRSRYVIGC